MPQKDLYIIAGCNRAGKTTASFTILPEIINCKEFVNADEIAKGLSPFQPETVAFQAGRIMLGRINELLEDQQSFAFETTLATRIYQNKIRQAQARSYTVTLLFFWLQNVELAIKRVQVRVSEGGHHVEPEVIKRRYHRGLYNLFHIYLPLVNGALIFDNSTGKHELLAERTLNGSCNVMNELTFSQLKNSYAHH